MTTRTADSLLQRPSRRRPRWSILPALAITGLLVGAALAAPTEPTQPVAPLAAAGQCWTDPAMLALRQQVGEAMTELNRVRREQPTDTAAQAAQAARLRQLQTQFLRERDRLRADCPYGTPGAGRGRGFGAGQGPGLGMGPGAGQGMGRGSRGGNARGRGNGNGWGRGQGQGRGLGNGPGPWCPYR